MFEQGNFYVKCHNIYYDQQWLRDVLDSLKPSDWVDGTSVTGVTWTVEECRNIPVSYTHLTLPTTPYV